MDVTFGHHRDPQLTAAHRTGVPNRRIQYCPEPHRYLESIFVRLPIPNRASRPSLSRPSLCLTDDAERWQKHLEICLAALVMDGGMTSDWMKLRLLATAPWRGAIQGQKMVRCKLEQPLASC
ncbi:hypothetical protein ACRE_063130 [Hapsidospora chrysogenum ATCC 11550]|uniref:Uncharacterized protein n=1 Tax=Hapsidospora chrysogenum (strain ATCC 11550 / CBS 779.69 / DSM 880 / IAM 14645 / JCM 23072 / IMI 49137) TaxID=857340 RepID=A0A086T0P4_HAPC1|nr:hypothetical protein ACRE_063130 [Hapsidospora chrysogenum ATCC 11550]